MNNDLANEKSIYVDELSLNGQFKTEEDFYDYLLDVYLEIYNISNKHDIIIYKSDRVFNRNVLKNVSLAQILNKTGTSETSMLRSMLIQDPFIELDAVSAHNECSIGLISAQLNKKPVLTITNDYEYNYLKLTFSGEELDNIYDSESFFTIARKYDYIKFLNIICYKYFEKINVKSFSFTMIKFIKESGLEENVINKVFIELDELLAMERIELEKSSKSKRLSVDELLYEFKFKIIGGLQIRFNYTYSSNKLIFLNAYIKKGSQNQGVYINNAIKILKDNKY